MSEAAFKKAYDDIKGLKSKPSQSDQLELYALGKLANGQSSSTVKQPGMFDPVGRTKWNRWNDKEKEGLSKEDAQKEYVKKFEELKNTIGMAA